MSTSKPWGQKSQPPNALEATWKDPVAEKQAAKVEENVYGSCIPQEEAGGGRARARAPPPSSRGGCPLRVRDSFYISIHLYLLIYPSIYIYNIHISYIYIYTSLSGSLSLFKQVMLLERA